MEPQVQYAQSSDGVSIAYWTMGSGGTPLVMLSPLLFGHLTRELEEPLIRAWYERLAKKRMLVRLDLRNMGLSQRGCAVSDQSVRSTDVLAVIDRLSLERASLLGFYGPAQNMVQLAVAHPDRVERLVLWAAMATNAFVADERYATLVGLAERDWGLFAETFAHVYLGWTPGSEAHWWAGFIRDSTDPEDFVATMKSLPKEGIAGILPLVRAPALVLHQGGLTPQSFGLEQTRTLASGIPDARLLHLGETFVAPYQSEPGTAALEAFLAEGDAPTAALPDLPSGTAVILFADIAESTALTERLGDAAFREKARELGGALRAVIRGCGGTSVEGPTLGDGVLAMFTSAREAIEAARRCGKAGDDAGLPLHLGLHAGDVTREKDPDGRDNVYGGAVNIASRISGLSAPGEVLVSETVRSLARTSAGVAFEDRGEQSLKGVGEPVRVWAVVQGNGD